MHKDVTKLKGKLDGVTNLFRGNGHQDVHEFIVFLLDGLHGHLNEGNPNLRITDIKGDGSNDEIVASQAWKNFQSQHNSFICKTFTSQIREKLNCLKCKNSTSVTFYPSMYLSLFLPETDVPTTLCDLLQAYVQRSPREWKCTNDACKTEEKEQNANGQLHFWKLSEILIVQLKRFAHDGEKSIRLNSVVNVPLDDIDFFPYFARNSPFKTDAKYRLYAVSNHMGT